MEHDSNPRNTSRRDFLSLLTATLGGVVLTRGTAFAQGGVSGGSTSAGLLGTIPNGYQFFRIAGPAPDFFGLGPITRIDGGVMINDNNEILFHAARNDGGYAVYELTMDYSGSVPAVAAARVVVQDGQQLPDGKIVGKIGRADTNRHGTFATVIQTTKNAAGVYVEKNKAGLQPIASFLDPLPGDDAMYGGRFGDLALHDNDDLLLVSQFIAKDRQNHQGLIHLQGAQASNVGRLILETGSLIPNTNQTLSELGMVSLSNNGHFVAQAYGSLPKRKRMRDRQTAIPHSKFPPPKGKLVSLPSCVLQGNLYSTAQPLLLSASRRMLGARPKFTGETFYGVRAGNDGIASHVTHRTNTRHVLVTDGGVIVKSGQRSPMGDRIVSVSAPVLGPNGLTYFLLITNVGLELCVSDGTAHRTLLSRGDTIDGFYVDAILHAFHSDQADSAGRIVFVVEFENGPYNVILGIPA